MRNLVVILVLVAVAAISQQVNGQTTHQKKQLSLIEREIDRVKSEILKEEKILKEENKTERIALQRQLKLAEMKTDPRRVKSTEEITAAKAEVVKLNQQLDSLSKPATDTWEISAKREELDGLQTKRKEMIAGWSNSEVALPQTMTKVKKNRYQNSNVIEREELVLNKIKNNINGAVDPAGSEGGYKVIFDNKYVMSTTFILQGIDGGEKLAISLQPKTKETHYVLPGRYLVKYVVNGRPLQKMDPLTIDGSKHYYESEPCFGFVQKAR